MPNGFHAVSARLLADIDQARFGAAADDYATFRAGFPASFFDRLTAAGVCRAGAVVVDNSSQWRMDPGVPLVVPEAIMIEPTETESKATLDAFAETLFRILEEDADRLHDAPHTTPISRPDEVRAARQPVLAWRETV